jgi:hypothetical protein
MLCDVMQVGTAADLPPLVLLAASALNAKLQADLDAAEEALSKAAVSAGSSAATAQAEASCEAAGDQEQTTHHEQQGQHTCCTSCLVGACHTRVAPASQTDDVLSSSIAHESVSEHHHHKGAQMSSAGCTVEDDVDDDDEEACGVCLDAAPAVSLERCGHKMCLGCCRRLCGRNALQPPSCPFCRAAIGGFAAENAS